MKSNEYSGFFFALWPNFLELDRDGGQNFTPDILLSFYFEILVFFDILVFMNFNILVLFMTFNLLVFMTLTFLSHFYHISILNFRFYHFSLTP